MWLGSGGHYEAKNGAKIMSLSLTSMLDPPWLELYEIKFKLMHTSAIQISFHGQETTINKAQGMATPLNWKEYSIIDGLNDYLISSITIEVVALPDSNIKIKDLSVSFCVPTLWCNWQPWSECSLSCGDGTRKRVRMCECPNPDPGKFQCSGSSEKTEMCRMKTCCKVDGGWSPWSYSSCSATCGEGTKTGWRQCNNPPPSCGGAACDESSGGATVQLPCTDKPCCKVDGGWSEWSEWGPCSTTCGGGVAVSTRLCNQPNPWCGGEKCSGNDEKTKQCNTQSCSVDGGWNSWGEWSDCSVTCGEGTKYRERACDNPPKKNGGKDCVGERREEKTCTKGCCSVDGRWSQWSAWSSCSFSCGVGHMTASRSCSEPLPSCGGKECSGESTKTAVCGQGSCCPVNGGWSEWGDWTDCSASCDTGSAVERRQRTCTSPSPQCGGATCTGSDMDHRPCNQHICCPVDGAWGEWLSWSPCSDTCNTGSSLQSRKRRCNKPKPNCEGQYCPGNDTEHKKCNRNVCCPVAGNWSDWSAWSDCSASCGGGFYTRSRSCSNPAPKCNGSDCMGESLDNSTCNDVCCPVKFDMQEYIIELSPNNNNLTESALESFYNGSLEPISIKGKDQFRISPVTGTNLVVHRLCVNVNYVRNVFVEFSRDESKTEPAKIYTEKLIPKVSWRWSQVCTKYLPPHHELLSKVTVKFRKTAGSKEMFVSALRFDGCVP